MTARAQECIVSRFADVSRRLVGAAYAAPCTLLICVVAILAATSETANCLFELQRPALFAGQWWRLFTGHVVHFGANHLIWDLAMFAALGGVCEARRPGRTRWTLLISAAAISLSLVAFLPQIDSYRGLSGVDSALFGLLVTSLLSDQEYGRHRSLVACMWILLAGFAAKVGYEVATGATFFVDSAAARFTPIPLAHAIGFAVGVTSSIPALLAYVCSPARPECVRP